jgi:hypothetical protein
MRVMRLRSSGASGAGAKAAVRRARSQLAPERPPEDREAQERTAAVLARLAERGWHVVADVDRRHGAVDHVAIGPGGVFVLASRRPAGCVRVKDGVLWLRRGADALADRPGLAIHRQAREAARALDRRLGVHTEHRLRVHPVVVLWSEFPQRVAETRQIAFVQGRELLGWLATRSARLDAAAQAEVAQAVAEIAREGLRRTPHLPSRHKAA